MRITNLFSLSVMASSLIIFSSQANAENTHEMMSMHEEHRHHLQTQQSSDTSQENESEQSTHNQNVHPQHAHDAAHMKEHGGQVYQSTSIENQWMLDDDGKGTLKSKVKTWIGTDENKLFLTAHLEKAESSAEHYDISALYSRNIAEFWDLQAGARYRHDQHRREDKQQVDAQFGVHGLAPYFFETEAYVYFGKDDQVALSLDLERDFLITQKWIMQPYVEAEIVINDDSKYAKKTGLSSAEMGLKTRYEINKNVMPFIDIAYAYDKGNQATAWQSATKSDSGLRYGGGITFKF